MRGVYCDAVRCTGSLPTLPQAEKIESPGTTDSYYAWGVEQIAGDIKESVARVSEMAFDASENANIPTVSYEVGGRVQHVGLKVLSPPVRCLTTLVEAVYWRGDGGVGSAASQQASSTAPCMVVFTATCAVAQLPDGQELQIGADRFKVPELLFNPVRCPCETARPTKPHSHPACTAALHIPTHVCESLYQLMRAHSNSMAQVCFAFDRNTTLVRRAESAVIVQGSGDGKDVRRQCPLRRAECVSKVAVVVVVAVARSLVPKHISEPR